MSDVTTLLEADHREVEDLFAKAESTNGAAKQQVVAKLADELTIHAEVEEQIVYPAMREAGLDDLIDEAESEHRKVKELVARLKTLDASSGEVDAVLAELKRDVEHHVHEEESEAFPRFRSSADQGTLSTLGAQVEEMKQSQSA